MAAGSRGAITAPATSAPAEGNSRGGRHIATEQHRWLPALLALSTTATVVFLLPAMELLRLNSEYFVGGFSDGLYLYVLAGLVLVTGFLAWALRRNPAARYVFWFLALVGPAWLVYTAVSLVAPRNWVFLAIASGVVVAAGAVTAAASDDGRRRVVGRLGWIGVALVVYLGLNVVQTAMALHDDPEPSDRGDVAASEAPDLPNVYHLVLDEFQTDVFEAIRDDEVDRMLRGFTFFPEAITEYGRTDMALATVFGLEPYRYDRPVGTYMREAFSGPRSLVTALEDAGYTTHAYLHSYRLTGGDLTPFDRAVLHRDQTPSHISSDKRRLAVSVWAYAHLPAMVSDELLPASHAVQLEGDSLLPEDAPPISAASFRALAADEGSRPSSGQYVLGHFILPHFPSVMTDDCRYHEGTLTGVASQSRCALHLVEEFLGRLESLDRFDDSMILIHGDHGGRYVRQGGSIGSVAASGIFSEEFSRARSRPLLLVKPPGIARAGSPTLRSLPHPALLSDVGATIHAGVGLGSQPAPAGSSLIGADFPSRPVRHYHMYERDPGDVISGSLHRYRVVGDEIRFDARIDVPTS